MPESLYGAHPKKLPVRFKLPSHLDLLRFQHAKVKVGSDVYSLPSFNVEGGTQPHNSSNGRHQEKKNRQIHNNLLFFIRILYQIQSERHKHQHSKRTRTYE